MKKDVVNELNALYKGEQMAIEAYNTFINDINESDIKETFEDIRKDHEKHAKKLEGRINSIGGDAEHGTGLGGMMFKAKNSVTNVLGKGTVDILKEAYHGEDKGIKMAEEVAKGDLDSESMDMVKAILSADRTHLTQMRDLISKYENTNS